MFSLCFALFSDYSFLKIHTSCSLKREINSKEYEQLKNKGITVIDVRKRTEIKLSGTIPGSLNIPSKFFYTSYNIIFICS